MTRNHCDLLVSFRLFLIVILTCLVAWCNSGNASLPTCATSCTCKDVGGFFTKSHHSAGSPLFWIDKAQYDKGVVVPLKTAKDIHVLKSCQTGSPKGTGVIMYEQVGAAPVCDMTQPPPGQSYTI